VREAGLVQLLAVELAVAEPQLGPRREGRELAAAVVAEPRQMRMEAQEEARGSDVVVDDDQPVRGAMDQPSRGAPDRKVEDAHRLRRGDRPILPERPRQVRHARVNQLREDLGLVTRRAQLALDGQRLVSDRVAVGQRGEQLVNRAHPRPAPPSAVSAR
jgi:hypothetical protein